MLETPELFISLNDILIDSNESANLTYGDTYNLLCVAKDSRPSVELKFVYDDNNNLEELGNSVTNVERTNDCNEQLICTSSLSLSLTLNEESLKLIKLIKCKANNNSSPFEINQEKNFNINVIGINFLN